MAKTITLEPEKKVFCDSLTITVQQDKVRMRIAPHYSSGLELGFTDMESDCIMYYYKLDEYPEEKALIIEHELNHYRHGKWNFPYHVWLDYTDTPKLLNRPNLKMLVRERDKQQNIIYALVGLVFYQIMIIPLQIYTAIRCLL